MKISLFRPNQFVALCLLLFPCLVSAPVWGGEGIAPGISLEGLPEAKVKEYKDGLASREKWMKQFPKGAVSSLDIPYASPAFQGKLPSSNQLLDLYVPEGAGPFPLIVWIHGGAWKGGNKEAQGADLAAKWLPEGFAVASLNYRFVFDAPFPGMFQDCLDAVTFLRKNYQKYHLDPDRVGIVGASAGGNLAGWVAMMVGSPSYPESGKPVLAVVLWAGIFDVTTETGQWAEGKFVANPRDDFSYLYPGRTYDPEIAKKMSPVYQIGNDCPAVLIAHGHLDETAPYIQSELFFRALQKAGKDAIFHTYPFYDHNLWKPDVHAEALAFFRKNLLQPADSKKN